MSTKAPRADAAAASVGACDLFVLRRVTVNRFVHFGGSARGAGWAGLIEVTSDDEASLGEALTTRSPGRVARLRGGCRLPRRGRAGGARRPRLDAARGARRGRGRLEERLGGRALSALRPGCEHRATAVSARRAGHSFLLLARTGGPCAR